MRRRKRVSRKLTSFTALAVIAAAYAFLPPDLLPGVRGTVAIQDGDTLTLSGQKFRLFGVDAPELKQTCYDAAGKEWPCGIKAREYLQWLAQGKTVICQPVDGDKYGREVGICFADGSDMNQAMARAGMAVAYYTYSPRYAVSEWLARLDRIGIWQGDFTPPEQWRKKRQ